MLEVLKFIFSSFWVWAGTMFLILAVGIALNWIIVAFRGIGVTFRI